MAGEKSELEKQMEALMGVTAGVLEGAKTTQKTAAKARRKSRDLEAMFAEMPLSAATDEQFKLLLSIVEDSSEDGLKALFKQIGAPLFPPSPCPPRSAPARLFAAARAAAAAASRLGRTGVRAQTRMAAAASTRASSSRHAARAQRPSRRVTQKAASSASRGAALIARGAARAQAFKDANEKAGKNMSEDVIKTAVADLFKEAGVKEGVRRRPRGLRAHLGLCRWRALTVPVPRGCAALSPRMLAAGDRRDRLRPEIEINEEVGGCRRQTTRPRLLADARSDSGEMCVYSAVCVGQEER